MSQNRFNPYQRPSGQRPRNIGQSTRTPDSDDESIIIVKEISHKPPQYTQQQLLARPEVTKPIQTYPPNPQPAPVRPPNPQPTPVHPPNPQPTPVRFTPSTSTARPPVKRVEFFTFSPPSKPEAAVAPEIVAVAPVKATTTVGIQTNDNPCDNKTQSEESASSSKSVASAAIDDDSLEGLVKQLMPRYEQQILGRLRKNFDLKKSADEKKAKTAVNRVIKGMKSDRSSLRELLEFHETIDPTNYPHELNRVWKKDLEKAAVMEREETITTMVEDLNETEEALNELDLKRQDRTATEEEQKKFALLGEQLSRKFFMYKKFLGNVCPVRHDLHKTQTQRFELKALSIPTLVKTAIEDHINKKIEDFLTCREECDTIYMPSITEIDEVVGKKLKSHQIEMNDDEMENIVKRVYLDLCKQYKYRRNNDLWRGWLDLVACPQVEDLELIDPANTCTELNEKLRTNFEVGQTRLNEIYSDYATDENNESDADLTGLLSEDTLNLEIFGSDDDDDNQENEEDLEFIEPDAVVPVEPRDFRAIFAEMNEMHSVGVETQMNMETTHRFHPNE